MFQKANELARKFTCPYVGLRRKHDGTVFSTMAAFIIINDAGWAMTAKHLFAEISQAQQSIAEVSKLDDAIAQLKMQKAGNVVHRNREIKKLEHQRGNFLSNRAEIWAGGDNWTATKPKASNVNLHPIADLAVFRIDPFKPTPDQAYPVFRSQGIIPGLSVCRIGFPWHSVQAEFNNNNFDVKGGFPAPLFALEGIVSRFLVVSDSGGAKTTLIQTSTPGLRGQSGGPLFDVEGHLCGLQSSTVHLDLGFDAKYDRDGEQKTERQFLNVGQAVHLEDIRAFLDSKSIPYAMAAS